MNPKNTVQKCADRVFATFMDIGEPMDVDQFGHRSISVKEPVFKKTYLTFFELQKLQKEFGCVDLIDGLVICRD